MEAPLVIAARFNGPAGSGNGGYTCGLVAARVGASSVSVTLRVPPPLDRPLRVERAGERVRVLDDDVLVAEGEPAAVELDVPPPVPPEEARLAPRGYAGFVRHEFPTCFVCGPERRPGDGLRIFAGPVEGRDGVVAAPWAPSEARPELVWAALDCPGAFAAGFGERGTMLLGQMAAGVLALPEPGESCVVQAWPLGEDGRKLYAGTALFGAGGRPLGRARQTWIVPR